MTTTVTVEAHCSDDKQVRIRNFDVNNIDMQKPDVVLQDGEKNSQVVYDGWHIEVFEEQK